METFLNIDWGTNLNDITDNEFINGEKLEKESVMHRMLRGDFKDPFDDMDEDYKEVKIDVIDNSSSEKSECNVTEDNKLKN
ncbi:hypothetical protein M0802_011967 [Mischocyttarus mexicanus]|nr:hypothetical protein M0802_011967 [Mischocyttarus mexicanus]